MYNFDLFKPSSDKTKLTSIYSISDSIMAYEYEYLNYTTFEINVGVDYGCYLHVYSSGITDFVLNQGNKRLFSLPNKTNNPFWAEKYALEFIENRIII